MSDKSSKSTSRSFNSTCPSRPPRWWNRVPRPPRWRKKKSIRKAGSGWKLQGKVDLSYIKQYKTIMKLHRWYEYITVFFMENSRIYL